MIRFPKIGAAVKVCYRKKLKPHMPLEGKTGIVVICCRARVCRNHGVLIDGKVFAIPAGNLNYVKPDSGEHSGEHSAEYSPE